MKVKFWGTRGSLPRPLTNDGFIELALDAATTAEASGGRTIEDFRKFLRAGKGREPFCFGGHTSCYEVISGETRCLVDMGTGITDAGTAAVLDNRQNFVVFQTHMHWDHVMGLPFFVPLYIPGTKIDLYHVHKNTPEHVKIQFNGVNFPVTWDELGGDVEFHAIKLYKAITVGPFTVTPFALDHPGGSFGYRFEAEGKSLAIGVDGEFKRLSRQDLGKDLRFYQNLDALVFDGQFNLNELASRNDWGHCSPSLGCELAMREGIRNLVLTHHDPRRDDAGGREMLRDAQTYVDQNLSKYQDIWKGLNQAEGPNILSAYDGLELDLNKL